MVLYGILILPFSIVHHIDWSIAFLSFLSFIIIITCTTQTDVDHSVPNSCFHNAVHTLQMRTQLYLLVLTRMSQKLTSSTQNTVFWLSQHSPTSLLSVGLSQFGLFAD